MEYKEYSVKYVELEHGSCSVHHGRKDAQHPARSSRNRHHGESCAERGQYFLCRNYAIVDVVGAEQVVGDSMHGNLDSDSA